MSSHERHGVQINGKLTIYSPTLLALCHRSPVDSHDKMSVMRDVFARHDVIMIALPPGDILKSHVVLSHLIQCSSMGLLPDTQNCGLRMRRECRERFPRQRHQRKPLVSNPGMHHGTCVTHVPWCMSGSLTSGGGENVPGIPGTCATRNFTYLARGP